MSNRIYEGIGSYNNSNLNNMISKINAIQEVKDARAQNTHVGDLVQIEILPNTYLAGRISEMGIETFPFRRTYYKVTSENGVVHSVNEKDIVSIEIIKTRQQIEAESKIKYPLVINCYTYTISIFENHTAQVLEYLATSENTLQIVDLSTYTNEEIFNMYNNDKEFLTDLIIKKASINDYYTKIDKLLLEVSELEEEQDNLYDKIDDMVNKFEEMNK